MVSKHIKRHATSLVTRKCKQNPASYTLSRILYWGKKIKNCKTITFGKALKQQAFSSLLPGLRIGPAAWEPGSASRDAEPAHTAHTVTRVRVGRKGRGAAGDARAHGLAGAPFTATSCAQPPAAGLGRTPGLGRGVAKGGGEWTEADEDRGESRRPHGRETQQEGQRAGRRPTQRRVNLSGGAAPPPGRDPRNAGRGSLRRQGRAWGAGLSSSFPLYVAVTSQA